MGGNEVRGARKGLEDYSKSLVLPSVIWESPECSQTLMPCSDSSGFGG